MILQVLLVYGFIAFACYIAFPDEVMARFPVATRVLAAIIWPVPIAAGILAKFFRWTLS